MTTARMRCRTQEENIFHRGGPARLAATKLRNISRKDAKAQRENELSFRTKREIFPRSLAFARDDRPRACRLASWRLGGSNIRIREFSTSGKFARAAQIFNYSSAENAKNNLGEFLCGLCPSISLRVVRFSNHVLCGEHYVFMFPRAALPRPGGETFPSSPSLRIGGLSLS